MPREGKKPLSSQALALLYLRSARDCSQRELADRLGWADEKLVSRYERGAKPLSRKTLDACAEALGYPPEVVDLLLFIDSWIEPEEPDEEPPSPEPLSPGERRLIDHSSLTAAWSFLDAWRLELSRVLLNEKVAMSRRKAQGLWERLKSATRQNRREAVAALPELQNWALAERVCEASIRAAAHKPEDALDLADLALFIAKRVEGDEGWRSRLGAYCWAHIGNARRVANDLAGADKAFLHVRELWQAGAASGLNFLPEWRLLDLEASLRGEERRFSEALELLERAKAAVGEGNVLAIARILLKKEHVFEQMGNTQGALTALREVAPFVDASRDPRLLLALLSKLVNNLCLSERYTEASERLSQVRELAIQQGNDLDMLRVVWLEARLASGEGRTEDAVAGFERVRQDFTARGLPYDAALASLDLALLWLKAGRSREVLEIARAMTWIFQAQGISREALGALTLFREAAQNEAVTVDLVQRVIAEVRGGNRSASLLSQRQRSRGERMSESQPRRGRRQP
jgi:transcriptional regulator with XRE-family HTH domain